MSIVVVGSIALDTVETPCGKREEVLGGSTTYFAYSASFFHPVSIVGVVGEDFPKKHIDLLKAKGIDTGGLQVLPGKTFRWSGSYENDMSEAKTRSTCLNVFETFRPRLPESYRDTEYVFLANIDPDLQVGVLGQVKRPRLVVADTMNFWIRTKPDAVWKMIGMVDVLIVNDGEARLLTGERHLPRAGRALLERGPRYVVIKKGEHGALLVGKGLFFAAPAFPVEEVVDPTGAGDTFAGGFVGALARAGQVTEAALRKAVVYGSVMASFTVEAFSLDRLAALSAEEIDRRYSEFVRMARVEEKDR